ncbi:MAG: hypothetical protein KGJ13_08810 [Patescibacteria group bacterium]|nr:hypothetical protein [Patescibacteria group bacterium]
MKNRDEKLAASLKSIGLSEKEVGVYLSALEMGRSTVARISRRAGINRTTGYAVLATLCAKGLVAVSGKEPKQEYLAEPPERIVSFLEKRIQTREEEIAADQKRICEAKELLPQLKSMRTVGDRPQIRFYEGVEGLRYVYEDTLTSKDGIRAFATFEDMEASLGSFYPTYIKRRAAKKIFSRGIVPHTPEAAARKKHDAEEYRELVLLPNEEPSVFPEIDIYGNKVMIASEKEKLGVIIESAGIAGAMKRLFELAWERAKQLEKS